MLRIFKKMDVISTKGTEGRPRRPRRHLLGLEALEGRQLLSLGIELSVNTSTVHNQSFSDNASSSNGVSAVAVWMDEFSSTDHDIHAQMFNGSGTKRGDEIVVENSNLDARFPSVAMDADGDWVVTWDQKIGSQRDILAQRFNAVGTRVGGIQTIAGTSFNESFPDVAMDATGNFVVSYTQDFSSTDSDVIARRFNSSGAEIQSIVVANTGANDESNTSVAMNAVGQFVIAWQTRGTTTHGDDVFLSRYDAAGHSLGDRAIATGDTSETNPSVGLDDAGNAVVAFQKFVGHDDDIKARRVSNSGVVGAEINIRNSLSEENSPTVALNHTGGAFVVAYNTDLIGIPGNRTVEVAEVSSSNAVGAVFNLPGFPNNKNAALSIDANGHYFLTYTGGFGSADTNIFRRRGHLS